MAKQNPKSQNPPKQTPPTAATANPAALQAGEQPGAPDPTPPSEKNKSPGETIPVLLVTAKREGFRRAGYEFGAEAKAIPLDWLDEDQVELLKAEPMLVCVESVI